MERVCALVLTAGSGSVEVVGDRFSAILLDNSQDPTVVVVHLDIPKALLRLLAGNSGVREGTIISSCDNRSAA